MIYVDLDDFCEDNSGWDLLQKVKSEISQFKATLFTIPARCSLEFLSRMLEVRWLSLVPHGWRHTTNHECEDWLYPTCSQYLDLMVQLRLDRGFKAPGWQISDDMYDALHERRYWVADQTYNDKRRPSYLPCYLLDAPNKIHGHIGHLNGRNDNELSLILPEILKHKDEEFGFVHEVVV